MRIIKAILTLLFPVPSTSNVSSVQRIGSVAGNGGWQSEDADHLKK
ncbi:hypothetical protein [Dictyobacter arantiisoli]|uniref:Uncharacterized protein n=1 Tax=Dictyobacter arantiisoli TaxID=2014874 RepID=A0A5A5TJI7_9CHLR|nr:hypothetical protein [Dictyobacter arantiisoli]GCF11183.1 hypothetical protein KDI_47470 [Dictyobacter arantiisoli]